MKLIASKINKLKAQSTWNVSEEIPSSNLSSILPSYNIYIYKSLIKTLIFMILAEIIIW